MSERPERDRMRPYDLGAARSPLRLAAKRILAPVLDGCGFLDWRIGRLFEGSNPSWLIAMYHRIVLDDFDDPFEYGMCVRESYFCAQLEYLGALGEVLPMHEVVARRTAGRPLPRRIVSITFDDGYLDNYDLAAPVLARLGLPWTLFVTTGGLDENRPLWWDRVIEAVRAWREPSIDLRPLGLGQFGRVWSITDDSRAEVALQIITAAWTLPQRHVEDVVAKLEQGAGLDSPRGPRRMSAAHVAQLQSRGVEIGCHTVAHCDLTRLSPAQLETEIGESRARLAEICARPIRGFAFPAGRWSERSLEAVRRHGFDYSVLTTARVNDPAQSLHTLGRIGMPDTPLLDFKRALAFVELRRLGAATPATAF